ncbi:MAG: hydroxypyruvate isomerase family protein [Gammaproteobacteria bacterium]
MKFSANLSMLFTETELLDRFKAARRCGFDAVEIQFPYRESPETLRQTLAENGMQLVLFNVDADDLLQGGEGLAAVPEKRHRFKDALAQTVEYIHALKPEAINVLPGRCLDGRRREAYLETFKENLLLAVETFAPLSVKTVFEAINTVDMPSFIVHSGDQMLDIMEEIGHPGLFMQYDIYHMHKMGEAVADFIGRHADKIGHIQFADDPGRGQPGTGTIDFKQLFGAIERSGYRGWVGAEYKPTGSTEQSLQWFCSSKTH